MENFTQAEKSILEMALTQQILKQKKNWIDAATGEMVEPNLRVGASLVQEWEKVLSKLKNS